MSKISLFMRITCFCVLALFSVPALAAMEYGYGRRMDAAGVGNARHEQNQQLRQEAAGSYQKIEQALTSLLEKVNKNERPDSTAIKAAAEILISAKPYAREFEDKEKAAFMLLQSWVYFFQGDVPQSWNWSLRSCKTYEPAKDGWATQAVFSMLNGKPPIKPRPPRPQHTRRRPTRYNQMTEKTEVAAASEPGVLDFDITDIRDEYFRQQLTRFTLRTVSGDTIEYVPGKDTLCMFFVQQNGPEDANDLRLSRVGVMEELDAKAKALADSPGAQKKETDQQVPYFEMLMNACKGNKNIKFVRIDLSAKPAETSEPADSKVPTVFAAMPGSGASIFAGVNARQPFMFVADSEGRTKYAGSAAGFAPAFILTQLTGTPIDLQIAAKSSTAHPVQQLDMVEEPVPVKEASPKRVSDPNKLPVDPNALRQRAQRTRREESSDSTLSLEDEIRAEKLLQMAQLEIGESQKLRSDPVKGIEACRKVLAEFPNTTYAQQARQWLRKVPSRYKEMNHITNEELGL